MTEAKSPLPTTIAAHGPVPADPLAAAQAIGDERFRAQALTALVPQFTDHAVLLAQIRCVMTEYLYQGLASLDRAQILSFPALKELFAQPWCQRASHPRSPATSSRSAARGSGNDLDDHQDAPQ